MTEGRPRLVVVVSWHHGNTAWVARAMADALVARVVTPAEVSPAEIGGYEVVGFGSGIYSGKHHEDLLALADRLSYVKDVRGFIFSTNGVPARFMGGESMQRYMQRYHTPLRERLLVKGVEIVGEFTCSGFNTNSFLRLFGGVNKGRPDSKDLQRASMFADGLRR